ncbi:uncharacterized protein BYT42DRAFT_377992 [Radiomyces spectabilis]|uniref:uncharacterized protein n=1 Tax=Radiomyces spectabilis TaxID=64574 RepID=UPI00221E8C1D|nr:uncharacterized protein BYT42DRAFT_377992 [Radiomyces spectabilis]KAI8376196.1 hypothetical protein BYT42DRAFT_377992 [Radiomyces spectabilis]
MRSQPINRMKTYLSNERASKYSARKTLQDIDSGKNKKRKKGKAKDVPPPSDTCPTVRKPGCENSAAHMKPDQLPSDKLSFAGTDYGIVTLATTMAVGQKQHAFHLKLFNHYEILEEEKPDLEIDDQERGYFVFDKPFTISADHLDWRTRSFEARKKREMKKKTVRMSIDGYCKYLIIQAFFPFFFGARSVRQTRGKLLRRWKERLRSIQCQMRYPLLKCLKITRYHIIQMLY